MVVSDVCMCVCALASFIKISNENAVNWSDKRQIKRTHNNWPPILYVCIYVSVYMYWLHAMIRNSFLVMAAYRSYASKMKNVHQSVACAQKQHGVMFTSKPTQMQTHRAHNTANWRLREILYRAHTNTLDVMWSFLIPQRHTHKCMFNKIEN